MWWISLLKLEEAPLKPVVVQQYCCPLNVKVNADQGLDSSAKLNWWKAPLRSNALKKFGLCSPALMMDSRMSEMVYRSG